MLLCNYVFVTAASNHSYAPAIVVVVDVGGHRMPTILPILRSSLLASMRRAWRVVTPLTLTTVDPEEVDVASHDLQLRLRPFLRLPPRDNHNTVALHLILTFFIPHHLVPRRVVMLVHGSPEARPRRDHSRGAISSLASPAPCCPKQRRES